MIIWVLDALVFKQSRGRELKIFHFVPDLLGGEMKINIFGKFHLKSLITDYPLVVQQGLRGFTNG